MMTRGRTLQLLGRPQRLQQYPRSAWSCPDDQIAGSDEKSRDFDPARGHYLWGGSIVDSPEGGSIMMIDEEGGCTSLPSAELRGVVTNDSPEHIEPGRAAILPGSSSEPSDPTGRPWTSTDDEMLPNWRFVGVNHPPNGHYLYGNSSREPQGGAVLMENLEEREDKIACVVSGNGWREVDRGADRRHTSAATSGEGWADEEALMRPNRLSASGASRDSTNPKMPEESWAPDCLSPMGGSALDPLEGATMAVGTTKECAGCAARSSTERRRDGDRLDVEPNEWSSGHPGEGGGQSGAGYDPGRWADPRRVSRSIWDDRPGRPPQGGRRSQAVAGPGKVEPASALSRPVTDRTNVQGDDASPGISRIISRDGGPQSLVVTVPEAAAMLSISRSLAYELVRRGELASIRLGRRLVVPKVALSELIERHRVGDPGSYETESHR